MNNYIFKQALKGAVEKKGKDLKVLDLRKFQTFTDYFLLVSGTSNKHVQAIADSIKEECKKANIPFFGEEGYNQAKWVLLDYGDFIVHIFDEEVREYYDIEGLWLDAEKIDIESVYSEAKP
jgi:ribosome-associated protein